VKRLNPKTNQPFKMGDIREDGLIFWGYTTSFIKNGFFYESWLTPEKHKAQKLNGNLKKQKHVCTNSGRAVKLLQNAIARSKKNKRKIEITKEWIEKKLEKGVCELTGIPFKLVLKGETHMNPCAPSLDRIDNSAGYTKTNTRVVLAAVNTALGEHGDKVMLPILEAMVKGIKKNAQKKSTTSVPKRSNRKSKNDTQSSFIPSARTWEDRDDANDYRGAVQGENSYRRTKEGGGDSVGYRDAKVGALKAPKDSQDTRHPESTVNSAEEFFERVRSKSRELDLAIRTGSKIRQSGD
jgi:hypothetical protein